MPDSESKNSPAVHPNHLRDIAVRIAEDAAAHVRKRRPEVFGDGGADRVTAAGTVQAKSTPTDPVTVVDTETEQLVRDLLAELRPGDAVLGEEGGGAADSIDGIRWVVDPIDGTVNFMYGIPAYAISVAVQIDGRSVAGAVVDVAREVTYSAALGAGATRTNADGTSTRLRCNDVDSVSMALMATGFGYGSARRAEQGRIIAALLPRVRDVRRIGSAALDLCMVASGQVDAHFEHGLSPWDWAAGALIAAEAGADVQLPGPEVMSAAGEPVVAAAPGLATELRAVFDELGVYAAIPDA